MIDEQLGRYRLIRRLASGGMGEVYLGEVAGAANFTKQVAIKRILPHLAQDPDFVERFIDEANVMVQLHHGNIVPVLELSDEGGQLFIVMEYVPGRDLKNVIRALRSQDTKLPIDLAVWLIRQVLTGLDYAHRKSDEHGQPMNIVHRDVSPGNVMLGAGGEVKLVDFGIARARGRLQNSVSGTLQGKFVYMSPEQAEGRKVNAASDIFSCGLVLYELISGERPFEGESETDTLRKVRECEITPPHQINPKIPEELSQLVMKSLAMEPVDRFSSAEEMAQSLRDFLVHQSSDAGAGRLSAFLVKLFPKGVIPQEEYTPSSIDDALNLQLDAFTPSIQSFEHTRTRTGPHEINAWSRADNSVSQRRELSSPGSQGDSSLVQHSEYISQISHQSPSGGRKRMLVLGLLLGATSAAAFIVSERSGQTEPPVDQTVALHVDISPQAAQNVALTVNNAPFQNGDRLDQGRNHVICAVADNYREHCERVRLQSDDVRVAITLQKLPTLVPTITPKGIPHEITVDGVQSNAWPMHIHPDREYIICVSADGYVATPKCHRIRGIETEAQPHFRLEAKPVSEPQETSLDTGLSKTSSHTKSPSRTTHKRSIAKAKRNQSKTLTLKSIPTASVWVGARQVGSTPFKAKIDGDVTVYTLRARGYADTQYTVRKTTTPGVQNVSLHKPGYITLRVTRPPASEIWIDGRKVATGMIRKHPVSPGPHVIEVKYFQKDQLVATHRYPSIELESGEDLRLPPFVLDIGQK